MPVAASMGSWTSTYKRAVLTICWWLAGCIRYTQQGGRGEMSLTVLIISTSDYHVGTPVPHTAAATWVRLATLYSRPVLLCLPSVQQVFFNKTCSVQANLGPQRRNRGEEGSRWDQALPLSLLRGLLCSCPRVQPLLHAQVQSRDSEGCHAVTSVA